MLHWNLARRSIQSGALIYALATQDDASDELITYLAYGKQLSDRATLQSSGRVILPVDDTSDGEVELAGIEFPLSDQSYETRYHLVLLWDFADGSFFKGW